LKKFFIVLFLLLASLPAMAQELEILILTKLIDKNFNKANPKSLLYLIEKLNDNSKKINPKNSKRFIKKANKIYQKQISISKQLLKFEPKSLSKPKLKILKTFIKEYEYNLDSSIDIGLSDDSISLNQDYIKSAINDVMIALEDDLNVSKNKFLNQPNQAGIFGLTEEIYGNCMPSSNQSNYFCNSEFRSMDLIIRQPATIRDLDPSGALITEPKLISKISSDDNGYFEINLNPGLYSIFVLNGDQEFCTNNISADGLACLVEVTESSKTFYKSILDNAVW
jgi:hypothetical protein